MRIDSVGKNGGCRVAILCLLVGLLSWGYGGSFCTGKADGGFESFTSLPPRQSDDDCSEMMGTGTVCRPPAASQGSTPRRA